MQEHTRWLEIILSSLPNAVKSSSITAHRPHRTFGFYFSKWCGSDIFVHSYLGYVVCPVVGAMLARVWPGPHSSFFKLRSIMRWWRENKPQGCPIQSDPACFSTVTYTPKKSEMERLYSFCMRSAHPKWIDLEYACLNKLHNEHNWSTWWGICPHLLTGLTSACGMTDFFFQGANFRSMVALASPFHSPPI